MMRLHGPAIALILATCLAAGAPAAPASVTVDPPRDAANPASNRKLLIRSGGSDMHALLFKAQGQGPKPTVILLHGLPGNERNLDLAQALRRVGWDVLTFTYRGAWGSGGNFTLANSYQDAEAVLAFARSTEGAALGIDPKRIVLVGHSFGGAIASATAAKDKAVAGLVLLDAWNVGEESAGLVAAGAQGRTAFIAGFDDLDRTLAGATAEKLADELIALGGRRNLLGDAEDLRATPILTIYATHGGRDANAALAERLKASGNSRVTALEIDSDHSFADHRIALAQAVAAWLEALPAH